MHQSEVTEIVTNADTFIFDCDGVLWNGSYLIEGTIPALQQLRAENKKLLFITNNSAKSRTGVVDKFKATTPEVGTPLLTRTPLSQSLC